MTGQRRILKVSVLGMDERARAAFDLFLRGPCRNRAVSVSPESSEIAVIDVDGINGRELYQQHRKDYPYCPVILVSLTSPDDPRAIFVRKPVKPVEMIAALEEARMVLDSPQSRSEEKPPQPEPNPQVELSATAEPEGVDATVAVKPAVAANSRTRRSTHQTAMLLDESGYSAYVGTVADIDPQDPEQVETAHYRKNDYLQGALQSAIRLAVRKKRILRLNCGWKPITIFPHSGEVWVNADDKQLRAFCVVPIGSMTSIDMNKARSSSVSVTAVNPDTLSGVQDSEKFQPIDALLWKIALWTSNGRVPAGIDLNHPVYLSCWPNLSRLVVIPHSLRIAALMIEHPRTLPDIAKLLKVRQQYVFSFFSAAAALGLAGQAKRESDRVVAADEVPARRNGGLLQRIIRRLQVRH